MAEFLPKPTLIALHVLMAFFYLVAPWLNRASVRHAEARIDRGDKTERSHLYLMTIVSQVGTVVAFAALVIWGRVPARSVGLGPPRSWPVEACLVVLLVAYIVWSGLRMRAKAREARKAIGKRADVLVPRTNTQREWYSFVSLGSGIEEEFVCRGFAFFYLRLLFPGIGLVPVIVITSVAFGFAHFYQGVKGVLIASAAGAVLAVIYLATGNLLLPVLAHSLDNFRLVFLPAKAEKG
ncbi:MAG TPA: CPBP family intramembrane glutamic endopeptidase [Opitutaceae bacterium]